MLLCLLKKILLHYKPTKPANLGHTVGIVEMRRHYTNYFKGIHGFKAHLQKLVTTDNLEELMSLFDEIADFHNDYVIE